MDASVKRVEAAAREAGCDGNKTDLIAFSAGFSKGYERSPAGQNERIAQLEDEVARLKKALGEKVGARPSVPSQSREEKSRAKEGTTHTLKAGGKIGGHLEIRSDPPFLQERLLKYEEIKKVFLSKIEAKPNVPIKITLPDGTVKEGVSWKTTPLDIARTISKKLAKTVCVAEIKYTGDRISPMESVAAEEDMVNDVKEEDGKMEEDSDVLLWDVFRPFEGDCSLKLIKFEEKIASPSQEGKTAFWHSSAHVLGQAMERCFGVKLTIGPALSDGFYYDCYSGKATITESEWYDKINGMMAQIVKENQTFERVVCSKSDALRLFADNPFKLELIRTKIPDGGNTTVYRNGPFVDLCMGPHVPSTKMLNFMAIKSHSATYWRGNDNCDSLQRMYAISFPDRKMMNRWKKDMEARKKNDHRLIGTSQKLFFHHDLSPGSAFFLPHGARVYSRLMQFIRTQYWQRGYCEVVTPNIYDSTLFKISGHYQKYEKDMYWIHDKADEFGLKPMNCPGHCLMFRHTVRSHRELPIRYADFGVLHRNELKGALSGLTRVRRFQQDDAHIFCRGDQVEDEVVSALGFMKYVYDVFGMSFVLQRSTRPEKAVGADTSAGIQRWNDAEEALGKALDKFSGKNTWTDNPGDGAFYGPKIDIKVKDCMGRKHQCATVQLDFQLPIRFDLTYKTGEDVKKSDKKGNEEAQKTAKNKKTSSADEKRAHKSKGLFKNLPNTKAEPAHGLARPVMVHRAMLGSVERMTAILIEHFAGKWPLWVSPRQVMVIPLHADQFEFALEVSDRIKKFGFYVEADVSKETFRKKIRTAVKSGYNYQLIVGKEEVKMDTVSVRVRGSNDVEKGVKVEEMIQRLRAEANGHKKSPELLKILEDREK